jgi:hypothetical protein
MNLRRWSSVILMMGLILALNSLSAQADPYRPYHHPHGHAYGWDGPRPHDFGRHHKQFRHSCWGPRNPHYVDPVAPVMGIPYAQPQPYFNQPSLPGPPGFHGQFNYNF